MVLRKFMMVGLVLLAASQARADGFVCETDDGELLVKVYNMTQPEHGTRNAAVMILSDNTVQDGRKTIAKFSGVKGTLGNSGATYLAKVDLRFKDIRRKGEYLLGTRLGQLDSIILDVNFSYGYPVRSGEELDGQLLAFKRNGETIAAPLSCIRYLKN